MGEQRERALPTFLGCGANGKSALINTPQAALDDCVGTAARSLFTQKGSDRHPTGLADLEGLRLATIQETRRNRRLNES